jgi:hypothetical protein
LYDSPLLTPYTIFNVIKEHFTCKIYIINIKHGKYHMPYAQNR